MLPWFTDHFGNAASRSHSFGWQAAEAVEIARKQVAGLLHAEAADITFTSGSTEGLNMAIKGIAETTTHIGKHIISVTTEHHAVLDPLHWLQRKGYEVTYLHVNALGLIDPDQLKEAIRTDTIMVVIMWANNETGVIQHMHEIGGICARMGVTLICDATQAAGKIEIDLERSGIDIVSVSAHKFYGPKGIGALYLSPKQKRKPAPLLHGGGHEKGLRSGTLNVPGIVGLGKAAELRTKEMAQDTPRIENMRNQFEKTLMNALEEVTVNGPLDSRLPTVTNLKMRFTDSQAVMSRFRNLLAISSGSACSSSNPEPSHVLLAMGLTMPEAKGSFRISFGLPTTQEEANKAADIMIDAVRAERALSPQWQMFKQGIDVS
jgi:cysteine desulfurase